MNSAPETTSNVPWIELLQDGRAGYSVMVVLGAMLHALQILVIAIIMPTVVKDVGGTEFYTWAAMLYTIGSIVGAASIGPVWRALGARRGSVASGLLLMVGTTGCALAPDMASLIIARTVQGYAGGLIIGGTMALVSGLFSEALRRRILTAYQGTWMVAQLLGPVVGGLFVFEALSVIIQVFWFKRTGKRVFRMAPIHHHFEQLGWSESKVVIRFWIVAIVLAILGLATLKLR